MGRTSVPGLWAVGNVTASFSQLVTFAADGTRAAMALNADLVTEDVAVAVARSSGQIAPAVGTG
jgi:thioredoxin reductase